MAQRETRRVKSPSGNGPTILRIPGWRHGYIARRADQERLGGTSKRVSMPARDNRLIAFLISGRGI